MTINLSKQAAKDFRKLEQQLQQRTKNLLAQLDDDPALGKPRKGPLAGLWSIRLANTYRVIYEPAGDTGFIVAITRRRDAYKP